MKRKVSILALIVVFFLILGAWFAVSEHTKPPDTAGAIAPPSPPVLLEQFGMPRQVPALTDADKEKAIRIVKEDGQLKEFLEGANWEVSIIGANYEGSEKTGASMHIIIKPPVWIEGEFRYPSWWDRPPYRAKLWTSGMHIWVDFREEKVIAVEPGLGKPMEKKPLNTQEKKAERVALNHPLVKSLGRGWESYLAGVWYTPEYPQGLAVFEVRSSEKDVVLIAVDLGTLKIIEKLTGRLHNIEER